MKKIITMRRFNERGRGCNQMFRYAFLTRYAKKYGAELQIPPWVGDRLFDLPNLERPKRQLLTYREQGNGLKHPEPPVGDVLVGQDFWGYAQYHTRYYSSSKAHFIKTFQPTERLEKRLAPACNNLLSEDDTVIGIHLRRGDYGRRIFPIIPTSWYLNWLESNAHLLGNLKLFIATEDPSLVDDFAKYNLVTVEGLGLEIDDTSLVFDGCLKHDIKIGNVQSFDWYPDFYLLSQCHVILGPSSTFSFMAAMLAPRLLEYWRASLEAEKFVRTYPWDAYPQLRECVRDYPHLEGISLKKNPYW